MCRDLFGWGLACYLIYSTFRRLPELGWGGKETEEVRISSSGRSSLEFGGLNVLFLLFMHPWARDIPWGYLATSLILGTFFGRIASARSAKRWQEQLDAYGHILPRTHVKPSRLDWAFISAVGVLIPLIVLARPIPLPSLPPTVLICVWLGFAGFLVAFGFHRWAWARRKEREGFKPLTMPLHWS